MRLWILSTLSLLMIGCLQTRETMEDGGGERSNLREQMKALQARSAQHEIRMDEILEEVRRLNGKVDAAAGLGPKAESSDEVTQLKSRLKVYEEALEKLDAEVRSLKQRRSTSAPAAKVPPGDLAAGDFHYDQKQWSEAIRSYEAYRQKNPTGKNYPKATLRIALAFQSMGMNKEAKAFFQEVASQYPQTDEARIASSRLSHL